MIGCNLYGGLGNYLFQIGAACTLAEKYNDVAVFNFSNAKQVHSNIAVYRNNILRNINDQKFTHTCIYNEPAFTYKSLPYINGILLDGYFQSEKYLDRNLILKLFSIDDISKKYIVDKYGYDFSNTVSIHVRRGDYISKQNRHPVQPIDYYIKSINYFDPSYKFYIFSDDIEWCRAHFSEDNIIFINNNTDYIDLWLMSLCEHNIIANSSFSWWAAWLNTNVNKKVIAPKLWFGPDKKLNTFDLIPESWITI